MTEERLNALKQKKYRVEAQITILDKLLNTLDDIEKEETTSYEVVGKEDKQAKDWRTGELLWEDDEKTIPLYHNKWDYVTIDPKLYSDSQKAMLSEIDNIRKKLEELI